MIHAGAVYAIGKDTDNGKALSPAPKWTANLGWQFENALTPGFNWRLSGNLRYRGSQFNQINESIPAAEPLTTLDLTVAIGPTDDRWEVAIIGRNVTNDISQDFGYPNVDPFFTDATTGAPTVINGSTNALRSIQLQGKYAF